MSNRLIQDRGHVYRFLTAERALDIFKRQALFFARPRAWMKGDPYEVQLAHPSSELLFAQCWCQTAISDAMWRLYAPQGGGVRVGVKRVKLAAAINAWAGENGLGYREGAVVYRDAPALRRETRALGRRLRTQFDLREAAGALFLKREAFAHENEWRAVLHGTGGAPAANGMSVPIDAHALVESLLVDPRSTPAEFDQVTRAFRDAGFVGRVKRSALYDPPEPVLVR